MTRWIFKLTGYALLAAVFALCLYTIPPTIESEVLSNATHSLKRNGMDWVLISIDGRDITLSGSPPSEQAAVEAVELLRSTTGVRRVTTTWSGEISTDSLTAHPPASIDIATIDRNDIAVNSAPAVTEAVAEQPPILTLPTQQAPDQEFDD